MLARRKQLYPYKDYGKETKLKDYAQWCQSKQKNITVIKSLERQNQKLLRQNILLKDQNKQLLMFKQKYLELNFQISRQKQKQRTFRREQISFSADKKYSECSLAETQQNSIRKLKNVVSARKHNNVQFEKMLGQVNQFQNPSNFKLNLGSSRRKRFDYTSDADTIPIRTSLENINKINYSAKSMQKSQKPNISQARNILTNQLKSEQRIEQNFLIQPNYQLKKPQSHQNKQMKKLQQQIQQLKSIQSKLLDRIQQRDDIIQNLQSLVKQSLAYHQKSSEQK